MFSFTLDSGLLAEYEKATDERKQFLEKKYGRKTIQTLLETGYSVQWLKENSKTCPHCNAAIEVVNSVKHTIYLIKNTIP